MMRTLSCPCYGNYFCHCPPFVSIHIMTDHRHSVVSAAFQIAGFIEFPWTIWHTAIVYSNFYCTILSNDIVHWLHISECHWRYYPGDVIMYAVDGNYTAFSLTWINIFHNNNVSVILLVVIIETECNFFIGEIWQLKCWMHDLNGTFR